jgi:hypothetical protein
MTWRIGERLTFSNQLPRLIYLQLLGQAQLCGCLYVAYHGRTDVQGYYMICVLFDTTLLLAIADEGDPMRYSTLAGIPLASLTLEEGKTAVGLQCHHAPHSWKLTYTRNHRHHELVQVACSAQEAVSWRSHIASGIDRAVSAVAQGTANIFELHSPLMEDIMSIEEINEKKGIQRFGSVRSTSTRIRSDQHHIIITNTQTYNETGHNFSQSSLRILRSQSSVVPSRTQTLAPRRSERYRLEKILADVWSHDLLPYPGLSRKKDPFRTSANHVMRKFSIASITSNFSTSKRSTSYTSIGSWRKDELAMTAAGRQDDSQLVRSNTQRPALVSFHTTPDAFLPADFELSNSITTSKSKKPGALRLLAATFDRPRPFSPNPAPNENQKATQSLGRAQSVRQRLSKRAPDHVTSNRSSSQNDQTLHAQNQEDRVWHSATPMRGLSDTANQTSETREPKAKRSGSRLLRLFQS